MSVNKLKEILKEEKGICLILWSNQEQQLLESAVNDLKQVHDNIVLENTERLSLGSHNNSTYNVVVSGVIINNSIKHGDDILSLYMKIIKPGGKLILTDDADNIVTTLKLNGFTNVEKGEDFITSRKPDFAVGSSLKLGNKEKVWKIDDNIESAWNTDDKENDEIIDSDQLLDEDDLKKPDASSLRVCGTTGLRKACADCSCGLAEELRGETKEEPKSSCGSCYLGDAFRCASCPYLGMPAFKPGEKVLLDLKSDI